MPDCSQCDRTFRTASALLAHCHDKADHSENYCGQCNELFVHNNALLQHLRDSPAHQAPKSDTESDNDNQALCRGCNILFHDKSALREHLATSSRHNWCFVCSRDFKSKKALGQHSLSKVHKSRNHKCPLCKKRFKVPSSIAHHIESGTCHNVNRHQVAAAVHSLKILPTISVAGRLEYYTSTPIALVGLIATTEAFNGTAYECNICQKAFRSLAGLNRHLDSAAHDDPEFECPKCKTNFTLVSGLVQHIESELCGLALFDEVEGLVHEFTSRFTGALKL